MRVAYLYSMKDQPDAVRDVAPAHASYWRELALPGYLGGPFDDKSGGLITFEIDSTEQANELVANDPFVREGLLESRLLKTWQVE
jgi:uncharacterized protein YciI